MSAGGHRGPRPGVRARGQHRLRHHPATRAAAVLLALALLAGGYVAGTHIRRLQVTPHCLASGNCQCRQFGEFRGRDRCPELGTAGQVQR